MLKDLTSDQILSLAFMGSHFGGIAHNINTPLTAIMGRMELLQIRLGKIRQAAGDAVGAELEKCFNDLAIISQCCAKIDDALKNSVKTSSGILQSQAAEIRLDELLKNVLAFLNADMEFKHKTLKAFDIHENIPPVNVDPVAFSVAFLEILYNARSAMLNTSEKMLRILMSAADGAVTIVFCDSGCGMPEVDRRELLDNLSSPREAGVRETGLQRIARLLNPYGVTYDIQSRPGETSFTMQVPVNT
jgi:signal transduction histidine kinase